MKQIGFPIIWNMIVKAIVGIVQIFTSCKAFPTPIMVLSKCETIHVTQGLGSPTPIIIPAPLPYSNKNASLQNKW